MRDWNDEFANSAHIPDSESLPELWTAMNEALRLTDAEAEAESPALLRPMEAARLTCWVGAEERPEFRRQSRVMAAIWDGLAHTKLVEEPGHNHFSILDGLKDPKSPIVTELLTD